MPPNIKIYVNGFVLSTLLFDCANNSGDQEGFLYGSITRNLRREISDQALMNTQEDILISICSSVPCGSFLSFYNNVGHIKDDELEFYLGDRRKNVIGWYRYRRYSAMHPSAREIIIHRHLRESFFKADDPNKHYFVFAVLSSSNLPNFATHSYDYAFFTERRENIFRPLSTTILNLGDTRNSYRAGSLAMPFMNSASFTSVMENCWNFHSFYEIEDQIQEFHYSLRTKLERLQEELAASDAVNATLDNDVRSISNKMQSLLATQEAFHTNPSYDTAMALFSAASGEPSNLPGSSSSSDEPSEKDWRKRLADISPEGGTPIKRPCPEKYFGSDTEEGEVVNANDSNVPSTSHAPAFSLEMEFEDSPPAAAKLSMETDAMATESEKEMNLVPSPSSTVEVVMSESAFVKEFSLIGIASIMIYGLLSTMEQRFRKPFNSEVVKSSSLDASEVKESNSEPASPPKEPDSSNPPAEVIVKAEEESEAAAYLVPEVGEATAESTSEMHVDPPSDSTIVAAQASSTSEDVSKKMTPPFIIYASKESGEGVEGSEQYLSFEESRQKYIESTSTAGSDVLISEGVLEAESIGSPTSTTCGGDLEKKEDSGQGDSQKKD